MSAATSVLYGALLGAPKENVDDETDEAEKEKLKKQRQAMKDAQRERPRQSIVITPENMYDQSFHDVRYYADRTAGIPHHIAWKAERARRRAILDRRQGVKERVAERLEKDEEWHARYDKPGSGRKVDKTDKFQGETSVVDERQKDKGKSDESRMEAAPLSRKARENLRQEPDDEEKLLARNPERKNIVQRSRAPDYYKRKNQNRRARRREEKRNKRSSVWHDEDDDDVATAMPFERRRRASHGSGKESWRMPCPARYSCWKGVGSLHEEL